VHLRRLVKGRCPFKPHELFLRKFNQKTKSSLEDNMKKKLFTMKVEPNILAQWHQFAKSKNRPLSDIIKLLMSGEELPATVIDKKEPKKTYSKVDPNLIRAINAIGNNLNQISRKVNEHQKFDVLIELKSIEQQMEQLLNASQISK
jgi:hypothetical protein